MQQQSPRILLIDDNEHGLRARRTVLENLGYSVVTAAGGRQGLAAFDKQPFDLVVTDYRMPDLRGIQVLKRIRDKDAKVPVIILSGYIEKLGLTEESTGADAVLSKGPTEDQDLVRSIQRLIKKRPRTQATGRSSRRSQTRG
jgi:CheY-like chemotaxis protein